ncbi:MAG: helix-turn-helix domain-containing protein [Candidatus Woesearchaeota archaeon]
MKNNFDLLNGLMTIKDLCEYFQITRQTLYNWTKGGLIKAYRVARKVYYKPNEVEEAMVRINDYSKTKKHSGGCYENHEKN